MAKESERKFLVEDSAWREAVEARIRIRQFYLASMPGRSVRIRVSDDASAMLTLKFGERAQSRDEFEYPVPLGDALAMLPFAVGRVIEKTRHHVRHAGYLYEVDVFGGALDGLVIAELETSEWVSPGSLPAWLGREITEDSRFFNAALAHGVPAEGAP